mmetsp:Transcript_38798/g.97762  ORF Transcript_38798/g.97762 Transcript_38798/m.97762 type:complete len:234 (+) Transcript_38798:276-977(+)
MAVKLGKTRNSSDHIRGFVHHDDSSSTKTRLDITQVIKIHQNSFAGFLWQNRHRGTTWDDSQQVIPATTDTTTVTIDQFFEWNAHFFLHCTGLVHVTRNRKQLGSVVVLASQRSKPFTTTAKDRRTTSNCFHVGHGGRAAVQTNVCGEGRLKTWLTRVALKTLDQRGLLTADVCSGPTMNVHIEWPAALACIRADQTGSIGLIDGNLEFLRLLHELTANVNVGSVSTHTEASQ